MSVNSSGMKSKWELLPAEACRKKLSQKISDFPQFSIFWFRFSYVNCLETGICIDKFFPLISYNHLCGFPR